MKETIRNHKQSAEAMSVEAEVKEQCRAWTQQGRSREMPGEGQWGLVELLSPKSTFKERRQRHPNEDSTE